VETLADNLLLLTLGGTGPRVTRLRYAVGGACLLDAVRARRAHLDDGRVVVDDGAPSGDPVLDPILADLAGARRPPRLVSAVMKVGASATKLALGRLADAGLVTEERVRLLGVIPRRRLRPDAAASGGLRDRARSVLIAGEPADEEAATLIVLAGAGRMHRSLYARDERKTAAPRIRALEVGADVAAVVAAIRKAIDTKDSAAAVAAGAAGA
jgi:hypothetical protein